MATAAQQELFACWAGDSGFVLDEEGSVKRQFAMLAQLLGWVGGEETWNVHWMECFGEEYVWRASVPNVHKESETVSETSPDSTPLPDEDGESLHESHHHASSNASHEPSENGESTLENSDNHWAQFEGFIPDPQASFNAEFNRLARHCGWTKAERRRYKVELFDAEFAAHLGSDVLNIVLWQNLCRICTIDPVPDTIPECIQALEDMYINIYDVVDYERNGTPVVPFEEFHSFRKYTLKNRIYPIEEAKANSFYPVFLRQLFPQRQHV